MTKANWFVTPIIVEWNNDVGPDDDGYWEWWELIDAKGVVIAKCDDEAIANKLADLLNERGR